MSLFSSKMKMMFLARAPKAAASESPGGGLDFGRKYSVKPTKHSNNPYVSRPQGCHTCGVGGGRAIEGAAWEYGCGATYQGTKLALLLSNSW